MRTKEHTHDALGTIRVGVVGVKPIVLHTQPAISAGEDSARRIHS